MKYTKYMHNNNRKQTIQQVLKLLKVGGKAAVVVSSAIGGGGDNTATVMTTTMTTTKRELTFAGFVSVSVSSKDERIVFGERPAWAVGASAPVRLSFKSKPQNVEASKLAAGVATATAAVNGNSNGTNVAANGTGSVGKKATWKLALDDDDVGGGMFGEAVGDGGEGEEDDLVDEDALLEASAPVKRTTETVSNRWCVGYCTVLYVCGKLVTTIVSNIQL